MSLVVTKAALALKNAEANFKIVKFESYKPKAKKNNGVNVLPEKSNKEINKDMDLKRIRHEIVRFGMQGFDPTKKEEAKIALAVSLGAKPPKREYLNYKELMSKRKEEKRKKIEEKELMNSKMNLHSTGKTKKIKQKTGNDVGHLLQSYGKVQKKELKKTDNIKNKKRK